MLVIRGRGAFSPIHRSNCGAHRPDPDRSGGRRSGSERRAGSGIGGRFPPARESTRPAGKPESGRIKREVGRSLVAEAVADCCCLCRRVLRCFVRFSRASRRTVVASIMTSSGEVSAAGSPSGTPIANQVPKYGTLIPNRIFVGGIAANTNEQELKQYFASHGAVKDCKIIADRAGVSKGYGFVTFESQEDAEKIIKNESDSLVFKDRKLNIGPAIRKQQAFPGTRIYEPSLSPGSTILYTNGVPYTFQNGMAVFHPPEGYPVPAQPQPAYPVMMAPSYLTQPNSTYAYQQSPTVGGTASQWRCWTPQSPIGAVPAGATSQYVYTPVIHPGEMMYQPAQYQPTDLTDASMIEAAAPPAEYYTGSQYPGATSLC